MKTEKRALQQGFTLVEIMIVVAIIGLLAAIGIPSFMKAREKSLANTKEANIRQVEGAIAQYAMDGGCTNGQAVTWNNISAFLRDTVKTDYDVSGETLDTCSFCVGGDVNYH